MNALTQWNCRVLTVCASLMCSGLHVARADVVTDWNQITLETATAAGQSAVRMQRTITMVALATHDALNSIEARYEQYGVGVSAPRGTRGGASLQAAAVAAAHGVLVRLYPAQAAPLEAKRAASLAAVPDGAAKTRGMEIGDRAAANMVSLRQNDGSELAVNYVFAPAAPGVFQPIPPALAKPIEPGWARVKPWAIESASVFRAGGPPSPASDRWVSDFNEEKAFGAANSAVRTAEQTFIGQFWRETSQATFNRIARILIAERGLDLHASARALALVNIALGDAGVAGWDSKYFHNFWRPITAIHAANTGHPDAKPDPGWAPLTATVNHPEYPSSHAFHSAAAVVVLAALFGDAQSFSFTTSTAPNGGTRSFGSFSQALAEAGDSRIYAGLHFRFAVVDGAALGAKVGAEALKKLRPLQGPRL